MHSCHPTTPERFVWLQKHKMQCWWCRVLRAFPVEELVTEDDTINAEMDPEDVFRVTENILGHHQMT